MSTPLDVIEGFQDDLIRMRHDLHAHPETAFEETRTAAIVAAELEALGIEVHEGIARTGVVGVLRAGNSQRAIGLRADMDALPIHEANTFTHRSRVPGKMHACGHDGHTTMLLGAARYLARHRDFDGTVYFIFQPAEEGEGGGRLMVQEGLFERFPMQAVYGMHNIPGIPAGTFGVMPGPMMASFDLLDIRIRAKGGHAAFPHEATDAVLAGSALVCALQDIVSRRISPLDSAVVSITTFHAGDTHNVLPDEARLSGTVRAFSASVRDAVETEVRRICEGIAHAHRVEVELSYDRRYPPTINTEREAGVAREAATRLVGAEHVLTRAQALMAAEDFAFMLQACPGAYVWLGNGTGQQGGCMVHNPGYDFNDAIMPLGCAYWVSLVQTALPAPAAA
ncbi:amidohydrolase [Pusillimonas caeni]|uniref:M20 aminoacylase family protein n=1 Tax=Pusillimonas caeni TaxID=1348472 RepID=UPI000E59FC56|nr:M20 aminoacylase family protein [Pusillimonas caeni]TFL15028.1 amidohydrolase [Pusillimonas caeni]